MTLINDLSMACRIALRDMRGGVRALWLLLGGCLIGVAAVALVGATTQSLVDGARKGAIESVGGDLSLRLYHRPPGPGELAAIGGEGEISITTELRPMVQAAGNNPATGGAQLVELKGVDDQYPLYGAVEILPAGDLHEVLELRDGIYGAVADPTLLQALGLKRGDHMQIGDTRYQLRGTLVVEPDRAFRAFTLGPRVMVLNDSLAATGLTGEGAEIYYYTRVKLPAAADLPARAKAAMARIDAAFPRSGWRMVNAHDGVPGVGRTLALAQVLLLFIGLGVMLVGGAGISGAVRAHVAEKMRVIAILKSTGATPRVVTLAMGLQIMTLSLAGTLLGVGLGMAGPPLMATALAGHLPFALEASPAFKPLFAAALFGLLVAALFAWWPLMGVHHMSARILLRQQLTGSVTRPRAGGWLGAVLILSALVGVVFWISPMPVLTVGFLIGALALAGFYYALGLGLSRLARYLATRLLAKGKGASLRFALGNLYRSGAPTGPVVMALGLTLTLLVALDGIGNGASRHFQETLPHGAPDLVAFSIKPHGARALQAELAATGLLSRQRILPFLHARVQALGGVAVGDLDIPGSLSWVVRGDRGVTFAPTLPDGSQWDAEQSAKPGYSMDAEIAGKLDLGLGDTLTLNVSGQVRTGPILKFHAVDWTGLDLDFPIIATPATFAGIPYTLAASIKARPGDQAALEQFIKDRFPQVPLIRVADVLKSFSTAVEAVVSGLKAAALMCGLAALVVLAGGVLQGMRERTREAVLFKVLGARKRQLLGHLIGEFLSLGVLVAMAAVPLGLAIAYAVALVAGLGSVSVSWTGGLTLAAVAVLVTLAVGLLVTMGAYGAIPARMLRDRRL